MSELVFKLELTQEDEAMLLLALGYAQGKMYLCGDNDLAQNVQNLAAKILKQLDR